MVLSSKQVELAEQVKARGYVAYDYAGFTIYKMDVDLNTNDEHITAISVSYCGYYIEDIEVIIEDGDRLTLLGKVTEEDVDYILANI